MVKENVREYLFLAVSFVSGWVFLYGNVLIFLLILLTFLNARVDFCGFVASLKRERYYLGGAVVLFLYLLLHTLVVNLAGVYDGMKASYGLFETLLLYFIAIPLYILSLKPVMSPGLLNKGLYLFVCGVLVFSVVAFFYLTGVRIFKEPVEVLEFAYSSRFGGNRELLGGLLMLEPQAMVLALACFVSYALLLLRRRWWLVLTTLLLVLFLSFTVTKSSILAFLLATFFCTVYLFKRLSLRRRVYALVTIGGIVVLLVFFVSYGGGGRLRESLAEIENIKAGRLEGGSMAPRLLMWKDACKHWEEYGIFGVGVYYKPKLAAWYADASNVMIAGFTNVHNSFLEYWIRGGLLGLWLLVSLFVYPFVGMWRRRRYSVLVLGGCLLVFFASNTCVLFVHVFSLGVLLFWLSAFYFYLDDFIALEGDF